MSMYEMTRNEWKFWPDRENATLRYQIDAVGTYEEFRMRATGGAVKKRALTFKEMAASAGVYLSSDRAWLIPVVNLPDYGHADFVKPKAGDIIVDDDEVSWTIGEVTVGKFGNTYKCIARALQLVESLRSTAVISRPAAAKDSAGRPANLTYSTVATVYCRVQQEADTNVEPSLDRVVNVSKYTAYLSETVQVQAHDRFVCDGVTYTIVSMKNPSRIWDLMSLDMELVP